MSLQDSNGMDNVNGNVINGTEHQNDESFHSATTAATTNFSVSSESNLLVPGNLYTDIVNLKQCYVNIIKNIGAAGGEQLFARVRREPAANPREPSRTRAGSPRSPPKKFSGEPADVRRRTSANSRGFARIRAGSRRTRGEQANNSANSWRTFVRRELLFAKICSPRTCSPRTLANKSAANIVR